MLRLKRVRLTRSIFLDGQHIEKGSIRDLAEQQANDLIGQGSAVQVNVFRRLFSRIWLAIDGRAKRKEE